MARSVPICMYVTNKVEIVQKAFFPVLSTVYKRFVNHTFLSTRDPKKDIHKNLNFDFVTMATKRSLWPTIKP